MFDKYIKICVLLINYILTFYTIGNEYNVENVENTKI